MNINVEYALKKEKELWFLTLPKNLDTEFLIDNKAIQTEVVTDLHIRIYDQKHSIILPNVLIKTQLKDELGKQNDELPIFLNDKTQAKYLFFIKFSPA